MDSLIDFKSLLAAFPSDMLARGLQDAVLVCVLIYAVKAYYFYLYTKEGGRRYYVNAAAVLHARLLADWIQLAEVKARRTRLKQVISAVQAEMTRLRAAPVQGKAVTAVPPPPAISPASVVVHPPAADATFPEQPELPSAT